MVRGPSIRRFGKFARHHLWDGAAILLFAGALAAGIGSIRDGAVRFADGLVPGMAAEASDEPGRSSDGVAHLPVFGFAETAYSPQLLYPIKSHAFPEWLIRAVPRLASAPRPVIAICIDDLGEDLAGTDKAMLLPRPVALSFLPYAEATPFLAREAEAKGHTVLAHVPMQALSATDPGPMSLTVGAPDIAARIAWNIARVPGLSGINNHEGSRFTQDAASLQPVMQALAVQHLFFFDSRTVPDPKAVPVAHAFGVDSAGRDVFLDDTPTEAAVRQQLDGLADTAKRQGVAIAIGHPHDVTLKVLAAWLAENHGVQLVTLREAMQRKNGAITFASR